LKDAVGLALTGSSDRRTVRSTTVPRFLYRPAPLAPSAYEALAGRSGWRRDVFEPEAGVAIRGLVDERHGLAVWALRGFEDSGGAPSAEAFAADARRLHERLVAERGAARDRIHLAGFSLGTHLAVRLARELQEAGTPAASVCLLAPFETIDVFQNRWYWRLTRPDRYETVPFLSGLQAPVLIVHGAVDEALPVSGAHALKSAANGTTRLEVLPGLGHVDVVNTPRALALVRDFILTHEAPS